MPRWVYSFGAGKADGNASMRALLGGKGAGLAEMSNLGLPVPPGFTITTEVCGAYFSNGNQYPDGLSAEVDAALTRVGALVGKRFGDGKNPLLVSVRSGAQASMPGMMDTVLNLGLNDTTVEGLAQATGDARFAYDSYRRFIHMYANVVLGIDHHNFEDILEFYKEERGVGLDTELSAEDWRNLVAAFKARVKDERGAPFPQDVGEQLWGAIGAVFGSWQNTRAKTYRKLHGIPDDWGTATSVQAMVFGNMGNHSATGVAFTRDPGTGEKTYYGEYLVNAQGEDVVAGLRTPQSLTEAAAKAATGGNGPALETVMPKAFAELTRVFEALEAHYRDMQDIEFTIEAGNLYVLQTRSGKRTVRAALKIAVDMVAEGLISERDAVMRIEPQALDQLLHPTLDLNAKRDVLATGLPASPGAASGEVVFNAAEAESLASQGRSVILVRVETSPEDIHGMHAARGILTARGGMTSHAAVVARGMGRPCVSGAGSLRIDYTKQQFTVLGETVRKGDIVTIDGSTGQVLRGRIATIKPEFSSDFAVLMGWADQMRRLKVRANAETPLDAKTAREFGAEGIGLCRTEHMFFEESRILAVREMILAANEAGRRAALAKLLPIQRADFLELFSIMAGLPVTIRLLDPPLHEFLPQNDEDTVDIARALGVSVDRVRARVAELKEFNPMLGHRGCRLGISYPEIYEMQARAIFEAALETASERKASVTPEIMVPLVSMKGEIEMLKALIDTVAETVFAERGMTLNYHVGTMIELPRAALRAGDIAQHAEFFSFGTNDLTQTTFGISRDDATRFINEYLERGLLAIDPFTSLDEEGVGELVRIATERGRKTRAELKLGICGEHGGHPHSIHFCEKAGLDYVSCSPYRVPIARLAAAQAAAGQDESLSGTA